MLPEGCQQLPSAGFIPVDVARKLKGGAVVFIDRAAIDLKSCELPALVALAPPMPEWERPNKCRKKNKD